MNARNAIRLSDGRVLLPGDVVELVPARGWLVESTWADGETTSEPVVAWGRVIQWVGSALGVEDELGARIDSGDGVCWFDDGWEPLVVEPDGGRVVAMGTRCGPVPVDWRLVREPAVADCGAQCQALDDALFRTLTPDERERVQAGERWPGLILGCGGHRA